jgi:hypothetical protein
MKELFNRQGLEPRSNTTEQFSVLIQNEIVVNTQLIQSTGAQVR